MGLLKRIFPKKEKKGLEENEKETPKIVNIQPKEEAPSEANCPYCHKKLEQIPKRKSRCPHCGSQIFVRRGQLLTEIMLEEYEAEMEEKARQSRIEYHLEKLEIPIEDFNKREEEFSKKIGVAKPDYVNVIMSLFNERILKIRDFDILSSEYFAMALFLNEENKECFHFLHLSAKMKLEAYQRQEFVNYVEIVSAGGCQACDKLHGKQLTIEEALKTMPIPNKDCTFHLYDEKKGFCRCSYAPVVKDL